MVDVAYPQSEPFWLITSIEETVNRPDGSTARGSVADLAVDDVAEQSPRLAIELHQLHLLDREEIIRAGIHLDPGQHHLGREILEVGGLPHHVFARQVVAALFENLNHV